MFNLVKLHGNKLEIIQRRVWPHEGRKEWVEETLGFYIWHFGTFSNICPGFRNQSALWVGVKSNPVLYLQQQFAQCVDLQIRWKYWTTESFFSIIVNCMHVMKSAEAAKNHKTENRKWTHHFSQVCQCPSHSSSIGNARNWACQFCTHG